MRHLPQGFGPGHRSRAALGSVLLLGALALVAAGCGGGGEMVPRPGLHFGAVPALQGQEVMVVPVQHMRGIPAGVQADAELAFALRERGPRVQWLFPDTLRSITSRSPGIDIPLETLPVGAFLQAEVERVGDPLYGHLRRLNALTGAPLALIPVQLRYRSRPESVEGEILEPAMELAASLVHVQSGRVLWFGIVDGTPGEVDDPGTLASAADALARVVAW